MFTIAKTQAQYLTYRLENLETQTALEVVPERGGIITQWQVQGRPMLYLDSERFRQPELSVRGGVPILFPICGNLPNHTYTHAGQSYTLKQHGFARDLPWQVVDFTAGPESANLTLRLVSNDMTRSHYPFDFELDFTYRLTPTELVIDQCYRNRSSEAMPFSTGFHPYFQVADKSQLQFDLPATELQDQKSTLTHAFSGHFDFAQPEIDVAMKDLSRQVSTVIDRSQGRRLTLAASSDFSVLVFWTLQDKDFYCLEPWTAGRNALNTGDRLLLLPPEGVMEMSISLAIAPL